MNRWHMAKHQCLHQYKEYESYYLFYRFAHVVNREAFCELSVVSGELKNHES